MNVIFLALLFFQKIFLSDQQLTCPTTGVICVSLTQYQLCAIINGEVVLTTGVSTCPTGYVCDSSAQFTCQLDSNNPSNPTTTTSTTSTTTTTTTTTTTLAPPTTTAAPLTTTPAASTAPTCTEAAVYPGPECNQYYNCVEVMWWWDYVLETCPSGQAFNEVTAQCEESTTCVPTT